MLMTWTGASSEPVGSLPRGQLGFFLPRCVSMGTEKQTQFQNDVVMKITTLRVVFPITLIKMPTSMAISMMH